MREPGHRDERSIRSDGSNAFAYHTMTTRLPAVLDEVIERNPDYPPVVADSLRRLEEELAENRPMGFLSLPAPDWDEWSEQYRPHRGERWLEAPWFFAEQLFYRRLIESVRWWETGRDPFAPVKREEYAGARYARLLRRAAEVSEGETRTRHRVEELLLASLWGNRIDLSYKESAALGAGGAASEELVVDERSRILELLLAQEGEGGAVHLVTDNAGSELTMDLLLADAVVSLGWCVVFHVKLHPTYVSDATGEDLRRLILRFGRVHQDWEDYEGGRGGESGSRGRVGPTREGSGNHASGPGARSGEAERRVPSEGREAVDAIGERLAAHFACGAIRLAPDLFWNSAHFIGELPPRLSVAFARARLIIFKGDVNYRRLSRDALWPPEASFAEVVGSLPAPAAVLRTMKSDTVFGLPPGRAEGLEAEDPAWKSNGRRGLIQCFG